MIFPYDSLNNIIFSLYIMWKILLYFSRIELETIFESYYEEMYKNYTWIICCCCSMLITSSVETKWAPDAELPTAAPVAEVLLPPCNGNITIIWLDEGVVECPAGDGWEEDEEGKRLPLVEDGGMVPIG